MPQSVHSITNSTPAGLASSVSTWLHAHGSSVIKDIKYLETTSPKVSMTSTGSTNKEYVAFIHHEHR
jgi:hypothetical protein